MGSAIIEGFFGVELNGQGLTLQPRLGLNDGFIRVYQAATDRYAAASGDHFAIHLDDEFARKVGLPGRIVHGLCAMALAGKAVLAAAGVGDPRAVRRLAVRFSAPLFPGETLTTRVWAVDGGFAFESLNGEERPVLKDGRAELR